MNQLIENPIEVQIEVQKEISVIIPTFNRENYIGECIESVLNQSFDGSLEIIISDDGSTDNTLEIAKKYGDKIKIIYKPVDCRSQGVSGTRNRGIRASTKPFICFLDSDDFFLPGHLKRISSAFEREPGLGFAFCRSLETQRKGNSQLFRPWTRAYVLENDVKNPCASRSRIVNTNSFLFRRDVFEKIGLFNESYLNGEDGDLWMRISEQFKGRFLNYYGVVYRLHEGGQLTKNYDENLQSSYSLIFEEAKKRYYQLNLKDQKRIFKIKYHLLDIKYRGKNPSKLKFYLFYLGLIFSHPKGYFQKLLESYFDHKQVGDFSTWRNIDSFREHSSELVTFNRSEADSINSV